MEIVKKVIKQTSWQLLGKLITSLSTFIILGLIARNFGEEGVGVYTLALAYLAFYMLAVDLGLNSYLLPHLQSTDSLIHDLMKARLFWALIIIFPAALLAQILPIGDQFFKRAVLIGLPIILANAVTITTLLYFQSKLKFDKALVATLTGSILSLLVIWLLGKNLKTEYLLIGPLFGSILTAIVALKLSSLNIKLVITKEIIKKMLSLIKQAWPISLALVLNTLYFRLDSFILSHYYSLAVVGVYNIAYSIFQGILVIPTFIVNSYYPLLIVDFKNSLSLFRKRISLALLSLVIISIIGTVLLNILSPQIIQIISGEGFIGSEKALKILAISLPAFFLTSLMMVVLIILKKNLEIALIYAFGLIVNFILNMIYIPHYSYLAAAWVTVVSEYLILVCQIIILGRSLKKFR